MVETMFILVLYLTTDNMSPVGSLIQKVQAGAPLEGTAVAQTGHSASHGHFLWECPQQGPWCDA